MRNFITAVLWMTGGVVAYVAHVENLIDPFDVKILWSCATINWLVGGFINTNLFK